MPKQPEPQKALSTEGPKALKPLTRCLGPFFHVTALRSTSGFENDHSNVTRNADDDDSSG